MITCASDVLLFYKFGIKVHCETHGRDFVLTPPPVTGLRDTSDFLLQYCTFRDLLVSQYACSPISGTFVILPYRMER
ncbi:hypothetical protein PISMIDRAFT_677415 [Pisolithus microcarpus 441]|uniref:Uncharacterized protein n=1 Tax=Pisolithus microcarpus 441 TaxID=765257 RepID=A0A0C9ZSF2_9AGAM|nr:hypothetical protein PISMIDRAFT_677415 [Pisolithus microcarpus 441]